MKRFRKWVWVCVSMAAIALTCDFWNVVWKERLLASAVARIGGRMGSIPLWPLGTEYRVTLTAVPNAEQLNELRIANRMRGPAAILFENCEIAPEDAQRIRNSLPNCLIYVRQGDNIVSMAQLAEQSNEPAVTLESQHRAPR